MREKGFRWFAARRVNGCNQEFEYSPSSTDEIIVHVWRRTVQLLYAIPPPRIAAARERKSAARLNCSFRRGRRRWCGVRVIGKQSTGRRRR